ncbi:MAG: glucose 1-dehydrogenase, partial [Calditrichaeota bacterium]
VAIVTGASKGIGEAIARGLAEFGASVVVSSRKQEAVEAVAERFRRDGLDATAVACHVGDGNQITALVEKTVENYGGVDILVNNAAINPVYGPIQDAEETLFDKIMGVNLKGPFELCRRVYPVMKQRGGGSIINISSVAGVKPDAGLGLYSISKAGLISLTQVLAKEWGKDGIRANVICPGLIQTKFSAALWQNEALVKFLEQYLPLHRIGQADEIAGLAVYLASPASSYCTGAIFFADGGQMIM